MADVITFPQLESTTERITSFVADSLKRGYVGNTANATTSENGLMSAADKLKLNGIENAAQKNVIELVKVNDTELNVKNKGVNIDLSGYLTTSGKAASATVADTFTRRVLYISDYSSTNTGSGVFFSGSANATIKMPDDAVFSTLTATNFILSTTASTTEGAVWVEWS